MEGAGGQRNISIKATKTVTIPTGATGLSAEVDLAGFMLEAIYMPAAWTAAALTFQGSNVSGGVYQDMYDSGGTELNLTVSNSRAIGLTAAHKEVLKAWRFIKIRSGVTGAAVNQAADRDLILVFKSK